MEDEKMSKDRFVLQILNSRRNLAEFYIDFAHAECMPGVKEERLMLAFCNAEIARHIPHHYLDHIAMQQATYWGTTSERLSAVVKAWCDQDKGELSC
jgi:hypothetical protein